MESAANVEAFPNLHTIKAITWYHCDDCFDSNLVWNKTSVDVCQKCQERKDLPDSAARLMRAVFDRIAANRIINKQQFDLAQILVKATVKYPLGLNTLIRHFGLTDRTVKGYIEALRSEWLLPIGSSKFPPTGYYWITDADAFKGWLESYLAQPKEEFRTAYRMLRANFPELAGQVNFNFEEAA